MSICEACGGVLGRDCFNTGECVEITADIARRSECPDAPVSECPLMPYATLAAQRDELLEALKEIAEHPGPYGEDAAWTRVEIAKAAIAKAEGL